MQGTFVKKSRAKNQISSKSVSAPTAPTQTRSLILLCIGLKMKFNTLWTLQNLRFDNKFFFPQDKIAQPIEVKNECIKRLLNIYVCPIVFLV